MYCIHLALKEGTYGILQELRSFKLQSGSLNQLFKDPIEPFSGIEFFRQPMDGLDQ